MRPAGLPQSSALTDYSHGYQTANLEFAQAHMLKLGAKLNSSHTAIASRIARTLPLIAVAALTALAFNSSASAEDFVVVDTFNGDAPGTSLSSHTIGQDEVGGGWIEIAGSDFRVTLDGLAIEETGINGEPGIAVIDTLLPEYDVQVVFTRTSGSGVIGGVFRYVDSSNYFAAYHDGETLKLVKVVSGVETVLDQVALSTSEVISATGTVMVRENSVNVTVGTSSQLQTSDSTFHGATRAGLMSQSAQTTSFRDFQVNGLSAAPGSPPQPAVSPAVVFDSFNSPSGTALPSHSLTEVRPDGPWVNVRGLWTIMDNHVLLAVPSATEPFSDQIAAIDFSNMVNPEISADITWNGGTAGIAWDVADSLNYSIVFWDGFYLVAGRVDSGIFRERGRQSVSWSVGETRTLKVSVNGANTRIFLDSANPVSLAVGLSAGTGGGAGFFVRGSSTSEFDNFAVRTAQPLSQPDPIVETEPEEPFSNTPIPGQAWVFDSFNSEPGVLLQHRSPELDPASLGWQVVSGNWQMFDRQASEQTGAYGDGPQDKLAVIDTGRDEYELDAVVEWDGGRVGVLFGGRSSGSDDAGRNGFLFFRNGDTLEVGKLIGGAYFTLDDTDDIDWPEGARRTMRVVVENGVAQMFLDGALKLEIADSDLAYSTWTGIFQRGRNDDRFDDFTVTVPDGVETPPLELTIDSVHDLIMAPGNVVRIPIELSGPGSSDATITASATPAGESSLAVYDSFNGPFSATGPELAPYSAAWNVLGAPLQEPFTLLDKLQLPGAQDSGDQRMVIESGYADVTVSAEILGQLGRFGLIARHDGSTDDGAWVMGWMDFHNQVLLIGSSTDGDFRLLGAAAYQWNVGQTRELELTVTGPEITLSVNGQTQISISDDKLPMGTHVGVFTRSDINNGVFDEFAAIPHGLPDFMSLEQTPAGGFELVMEPILGDSGEFNVDLEAVSDGEAASSAFAVTVSEPVAPQADAAGPYVIVEGDTITLDGTGSTDGGAPIVEYLWDIDGDGVTDLSGPTAELFLDYPALLTVTLTVVDAIGLSSEQTAIAVSQIGQPFVALENMFLLGDASISNGDLLQLTGDSPWTGGAAWMPETQRVVDGFTATFDFQFSDSETGDNGADGLAFVIQSSPVGIESIGLPGSGLGYELIENSIAIEIDNWVNSEYGETGAHVAVHSAGTGANGPSGTTRLAMADIGDETGYRVRVSYQSGVLSVYVGDMSTPAIELEIDLSEILDLPDGTAFIGFTASTGGASQRHEITEFHFESAS